MTGNITRRGAHSWRLKFEASERERLRASARPVTLRCEERKKRRNASYSG
jgi:hypothetical protein